MAIEKEIILKELQEENTLQRDTQVISPWMYNATKLHPHAVESGDYLFHGVHPESKFCLCGESVYFNGLNDGTDYVYGKCGWVQSGAGSSSDLPYNSQKLKYGLAGVNPHFASDNDSNCVFVKYGTTYYIYCHTYQNESKTREEGTIYIKKTQLTTSDKKIIGCVYVPNGDDGLWIVLSATTVYYSTKKNIASGKFSSISYYSDTKNINKYCGIKNNDMIWCEYGDYLYAIGCGSGGEYVSIKISKKTNTIVDIKADIIGQFNRCKQVIPYKSQGNVGTCPIVICGGIDKKLSFNIMTAPEEIDTIHTYYTNLVSSVEPQIAAFNSSYNTVAFIYNGDGFMQAYTYFVRFLEDENTELVCTGIQHLDGSNPIINSQYDGDYMAVQIVSGNTIDTTYPANYFSCRDGVHWYSNLGYIYQEDLNGNKVDVTRAFEKYVVDKKSGVTGRFVGGSINIQKDGNYYIRRFKIPDNIMPSIIVAGSTKSVVDTEIVPIDAEINEIKSVNDWFGNQYLIKPVDIDYNANISSNTKQEQNLIELIFNFNDGNVYYSILNTAGSTKTKTYTTHNSTLSAGTCYIDGGYVCFKSKVAPNKSELFVKGRVYEWVAIE